jgi:sec-independent protein translocase protein TatB
MFGMGMGELLIILVVALLFVGPDKLPQAAKAIGKGIRDLRRHSQDLQETIEQDEKLGDAVRELKSALTGDARMAPRPAGRPAPAPAVPVPVAAADSIAQGELPAPPPEVAASPAGAPSPDPRQPDPAATPSSGDPRHG